MRLRIVWVGKTRDPRAAGWIEEYRERIARSCPIVIEEIRDAEGKGPERAARERSDLRARIGSRALVIALDEGGRMMSSREFAQLLGKTLAERSEVAFLIGGAEGLGEELIAEAGLRMSLSPMTLPHEMARVVLLEQIFRAFAIARGSPYHR